MFPYLSKMEKLMNVHLLIIDPQNDFCLPSGNLSIPNADNDMVTLAQFVEKNRDKINDISLTLDSHHYYDISHPSFWFNPETCDRPEPFTIITSQDLKDGKWKTSDEDFEDFAMAYVSKLEDNEKYPLCIWPPHCLIGTEGHNVFSILQEKLQTWEVANKQVVNYINKGVNPYTEHYSAVKAEIPLVEDQSTTTNTRLVSELNEADIILLSGQASSHCVANTYYDLINYLPTLAPRIHILKDTMSPVTGFEELEEKFLNSAFENKSFITNTVDFIFPNLRDKNE